MIVSYIAFSFKLVLQLVLLILCNWPNRMKKPLAQSKSPLYYNGLYHLFYQYKPKGAVWGNIIWGHSISKDIVNWEKLEATIYPSKPFDKNGTWSGSSTILPVQNYAIPANISDPYLRKWIKPDNNPIVFPDSGVNTGAFHDPTTTWLGKDGHWRMIIGGRRKHRGMAHLYRSRDFVKWVRAQHPLHSSAKTGMRECPDFYPVSLSGKNGLDTSENSYNTKYVLKVSLDLTRYEYYTLGTYFPRKDKYVPDEGLVDGWGGLRYDYGNFYASKTFFDPTISRSVWLDPNGKQLRQWPVEEIETVRKQKVEVGKTKLTKGELIEVKGITAAQADVEVSFSFSSLSQAEVFDSSWDNTQDVCAQKGSQNQGGIGPFGLLTLASKNLEEYTPVFFRIFRAQSKHMVLPSFAGFGELANNKFSLKSLIDHSIVESFANEGKTYITSRVYPTLAVLEDAHLFIFNNGSETITVEGVKAWSMSTPKIS
ncbi:hypothetical protein UlMin_005493 [Ulmus minor]